MNKITIIKECIKAYNRENTIKANVVYLNPHDYFSILSYCIKKDKFIKGDYIVIDGAKIRLRSKEKIGNITVGYKPELILN